MAASVLKVQPQVAHAQLPCAAPDSNRPATAMRWTERIIGISKFAAANKSARDWIEKRGVQAPRSVDAHQLKRGREVRGGDGRARAECADAQKRIPQRLAAQWTMRAGMRRPEKSELRRAAPQR